MVDLPRFWEYIGELTADVVAQDFPLPLLLDAFGAPPSHGQLKAIVSMLKVIRTEKSDSPVLYASVPALRAYVDPVKPFADFLKENVSGK